jgi:hypothetical protein
MTLTACGASAKLDSRPVVELQNAAPPGALTAPCDEPSTIPDGAMNDGPAERGWAADRAALAGCKFRFKAAVDFYTGRDKGLSVK